LPRRNYPAKTRRARKAVAEDEEALRAPDVTVAAPPGYQVRSIQPVKAVKEYRCPGCNHEIKVGTAHLVAWRIGDEDHRRHWHRGCWDSNVRTRRR
jgi:hypothetical protein